MKKHYDNIEEESKDLFSKSKVTYSASKEAVWNQMMDNIEGQSNAEVGDVKIVKMNFSMLAVAASVTILIGLGFFFKFYSTTITSLAGEQFAYTLPDGSNIKFNSSSSVTYNPFWWNIERTLKFEGEAFFQVQKGSNFSVVSSKGTTQVLGTSFNISTRNDDYQVYCLTGKVRVSDSKDAKKVLLTPNTFTSLKDGLSVVKNVNQDDIIAWKKGYFNFKQLQLKEVFKIIEIQYGVSILSENTSDSLLYTGYFKIPKEPEGALNLICKSFGVSFEKKQNNYLIYQSN